jgi:broad specificity phosphatase PhoE
MNVRTGLCVAATIGFLALSSAAFAQRLVYVVRHAERADGGAAAGQMQAKPDPPLSAAGEARAAKLASMLADAGIGAIYATEFRRTQDTGKPLAAKLGIALTTTDTRDMNALAERLRMRHANQVVLVIGHSNTIPALIRAFGGPDLTIRDDEYDNLFVVVPATRTISRIRF